MKLKAAALFLAFATCTNSAMADTNPYNKPYDATYDHFTSAGTSTMRLTSDGQGHLRSEATHSGRSIVAITDWNSKTNYGIDDTSRLVSKMPMTNAPGTPPVDESKRTSLGDRMIDGRNCEGWQYANNGHVSQCWSDKDLGCAVLMTLDGKPQLRLKTCSPTTLPAQYFAPPPGYRIADLGEQLRKAEALARKHQQQGGRAR
ncbi:MAG: hypothetical protein SGJ27_15085 [Candidatus Melainabacteria bacterium]|nr:hypothetical protein [Candidatus Melainabacteria bacterium]